MTSLQYEPLVLENTLLRYRYVFCGNTESEYITNKGISCKDLHIDGTYPINYTDEGEVGVIYSRPSTLGQTFYTYEEEYITTIHRSILASYVTKFFKDEVDSYNQTLSEENLDIEYPENLFSSVRIGQLKYSLPNKTKDILRHEKYQDIYFKGLEDFIDTFYGKIYK